MINFIETNIHGAIVIYGAAGIKQYYGYAKTQAIKLYKKECEKLFINE